MRKRLRDWDARFAAWTDRTRRAMAYWVGEKLDTDVYESDFD